MTFFFFFFYSSTFKGHLTKAEPVLTLVSGTGNVTNIIIVLHQTRQFEMTR